MSKVIAEELLILLVGPNRFVFDYGNRPIFVLDGRVIDNFVHPLDVPGDVHLLLSLIRAIGAVELRLLAALPFEVVAEGALQLVRPAAVRTEDPSLRIVRAVMFDLGDR